MLIAKHRKAEYPNEWFLTDFTMAQVEGRIELLEGDLSREIDHSRFLEKVLEAMLGEKFDKITLFEASKLRHAIISLETASNERCDKNGMCKFLEERLTDGGKGFRAINTIKIGKIAERSVQWRGVSYHESAKDRGLLVNYCPWCGGKPGDLANRDTPPLPCLKGE